MTRSHAPMPVWTWLCDECGASSYDFHYAQSGLPSADQMRERGWYIAPKWGDLCTFCHNEKKADAL